MTAIHYALAERVATLTLNRPQQMNAFDDGMRESLLECLHEAAADDAVGCIVITGAGAAFCAGGDIDNMCALQAADNVAPIQARIRVATEVVKLMRGTGKPVIGAINGPAAGGGANLALACDIRYGNPRTQFVQSFVRLGLVPDWGGHYFLPRIVGTARALELMWTGERLDAEAALRLGILNAVFDDVTFMDEVMLRARRLAAGPAEAIAAIKRGAYQAESGTIEQTLAHEYDAQSAVFLGADAREGMRAFVAKRPPRFGR